MNELEFLRHMLATLAYRAAKAMRGATEKYPAFKPGPTTRTPLEIVAHMGDLLDWSLTLIRGQGKWVASEPRDWGSEKSRFFASLKRFDDALASGEPIKIEMKRLFQGPIADAFTHTGQLAMLRRMSGNPMKGESYARADIVAGRVGFEQPLADPKYEFD